LKFISSLSDLQAPYCGLLIKDEYLLLGFPEYTKMALIDVKTPATPKFLNKVLYRHGIHKENFVTLMRQLNENPEVILLATKNQIAKTKLECMKNY
jgi:hypothetical protein